MADFSNSKVGDNVYSLRHGYGTINCTESDYPSWPIRVQFSQGDFLFDTRGHYGDYKTPDLYHSKPEIIEQKRAVNKSFECNIHEISTQIGKGSYTLFKISIPESVILDQIIDRKITVTFQIEE